MTASSSPIPSVNVELRENKLMVSISSTPSLSFKSIIQFIAGSRAISSLQLNVLQLTHFAVFDPSLDYYHIHYFSLDTSPSTQCTALAADPFSLSPVLLWITIITLLQSLTVTLLYIQPILLVIYALRPTGMLLLLTI